LRKVRVQNRTQAAIWAMNHGTLAVSQNSSAPPSSLDTDRPCRRPSTSSPTSSDSMRRAHVN
jgi:two-component system nitrate/nitrite response regulator NarL